MDNHIEKSLKSPSKEKDKDVYNKRRRDYIPRFDEIRNRRHPYIVPKNERYCSICKGKGHFSENCNKAMLEKMKQEIAYLRNKLEETPKLTKEKEDDDVVALPSDQQDNEENQKLKNEDEASNASEDRSDKQIDSREINKDDKDNQSEDEETESDMDEENSFLEIKLDVEEQKQILSKSVEDKIARPMSHARSSSDASNYKKNGKDLKKENQNLKRALYLICKNQYIFQKDD